jgi:hypothetical protein
MPSLRPALKVDWPIAAILIVVIVCFTTLAALKVLDVSVLTHTLVGIVALLIPSPVGRVPGMTWRPPPLPPPPGNMGGGGTSGRP